jgi:serine/threonine-protein kinase
MGEVCRARDTQLHHEVALKVVPESVATDVERLARFQREAEVLAALNHPNIAAIYGLQDADGLKAPVMELVEGGRARRAHRTRACAGRRGVADRQTEL